MRKVVRLTESDLVRLVKRVLKEAPCPTTTTIKTFANTRDMASGQRSDNLDISDIRLRGTNVYFRWVSANATPQKNPYYEERNGSGVVNCNPGLRTVTLFIKGKENKTFYITPDAAKILQCNCGKYVSSDSGDVSTAV